jgi:hypothetical protein
MIPEQIHDDINKQRDIYRGRGGGHVSPFKTHE